MSETITMQQFIDRGIVVHTGEGANLLKFLKACEAMGLQWMSAENPTDYVPAGVYGDDLCVSCSVAHHWIEYGVLCLFKLKGYHVVDFSDVELPEVGA